MASIDIEATRDHAKSLADARLCAERREALKQPHMAKLAEFAERIRRENGLARRDVPDFDPLDGGIEANCLFLLEAPGAKATGSGFVSRNNPDETAKNFFELNNDAKLRREQTVTWNIVPWYVGNQERTKIRAANTSDIQKASLYLQELLSLLPRLRAVVLIGRKAQQGRDVIERALACRKSIKVFECPHPSPKSLRTHPERRSEIRDCLSSVAAYIDRFPT